MCSGIWPPSKPAIETPLRAFWPFTPRPAVLPLPEPGPRPTRIRFLAAPSLSRISLSLVMVASPWRSARGDRPTRLIFWNTPLVPAAAGPSRGRLGLDRHQVLHLGD